MLNVVKSKRRIPKTIERSLASHPRHIYFSDKNVDEKGNKIDPRNIFKSTHDVFRFDCDKCPHQFESILKNVTKKNPQWCPYCCFASKQLCDDNDCKECLKKSFASHPKNKYWSDKNILKPRNVFKGTHNKYWFDCDECPHDFESQLYSITNEDNPSWCPYCCHNPTLCDDDDCKYCYDKSFASHPKHIYWSDKNKFTPRQVTISSHRKCHFICEYFHKFKIIIKDITRIDSPRWCPECKNKTEKKVGEHLKKEYEDQYKFQPKFEWCKNKTFLPFDFLLEFFKIIICLDGPQHFRQVSNWTSHIFTQERDAFKMKCAIENGYSIIRIHQPDVLNDTIDWKQLLTEQINHITNNIRSDETPQISYIASKPDIYSTHRELMNLI